MPMNASTSGKSFGSSSRNRCGMQPETIKAWPRFWASLSSEDSRMVSTLSSCAASMKEQVLTMSASASAALFVTSTPPLRREPSMISASTRFLAQPREIKPTRTGRSAASVFIRERSTYAKSQWQGNGGNWTDGAVDASAHHPDLNAVGARRLRRFIVQRAGGHLFHLCHSDVE